MKQVHLISANDTISFQTCEVDNFLGCTIFELRSAKEITVESAAQGLKISVAEYDAYETGLKKPTVDEIIEIANFFKIDPLDLIHRSIKKSKYFDPTNKKSLHVKEQSNRKILLKTQTPI